MSLLQRVSSIESFAAERGRSPLYPGSRDRKLSFSPFLGEWEPGPESVIAPAVSALEVSKAKRIGEMLSIRLS
jgi:hypothetical protein